MTVQEKLLSTNAAALDWDKLKTFHAAAGAGSLTAAAELLNISQSAVSRQISALETSLGVVLFHRHARGLEMTEQGRLLYDTTRDIADRVAHAGAALQESRDDPSGDLHITAPVALGSSWLAPRLGGFIEAYPDIELHLALNDAEPELSALDAEAAIMLWRPRRSDLVQLKLMTVRQSLYASKTYLDAYGAPDDPCDLDRHRLVAYGADTATPMHGVDWALGIERAGAPRRAVLTVNSVLGVKRAIEAGFGIGSLPDYLGEERPGLIRILPDIHGPEFDSYFVYPEELRGSKRIKAFRDFAVEEARRFAG